MLKKLIALSLCSLLFLSLLVACGNKAPSDASGDDEALTTVVFTEPVRTYHWAPAYLAETLGYFKEAGLTADFQTVTGADASAPVFSGAAQFGLRGIEMALMSAEAGQPCKIIFSTTSHYPYQLIGANEHYQTVASLEGGVIGGGQGPASAPQAFARAILAQEGVTADVVNMLSAGYLAAIKGGEIQAAISTNPWASKVLLDNGGQVIVDGGDEAAMEQLMGSRTYELFMVFATDDYIKSQPETVQKVVTAMAKATAWMDAASPEEIAQAMEPLFEGRYEELLYCAQVDQANKLSNPTGYHSESGYAAAVALTARSGGIQTTDIPADAVYDESFLDFAWATLNEQ